MIRRLQRTQEKRTVLVTRATTMNGIDGRTATEDAPDPRMHPRFGGDFDDGRRRPFTILAAIDFSRCSESVLRWCARIAEGRAARIELVHAIEPSILSLPPSTQAFLEHRARSRLQLAGAPLVDHGLEVSFEARLGRAWEVVRERCSELAPDLVVVGSRGLSAMQRAFIGSNADRLLRALELPVLVVHEGVDPPERLHALVATDFSQDSARSLQALAQVFGRARLRLHATVLHVATPPQLVDYADIPIAPSFDWTGVEEAARRGLDEFARPLAALGVDVHPVVLRGSPARSILAEAKDMHADLVVLGRRPSGTLERWLLGSTAERVLHGAPCAVLTAEVARVPARGRRTEAAIVT